MTAKRFSKCKDQCKSYDWVTAKTLNIREIIDFLNTFDEENTLLKQDLNGLLTIIKNQSVIIQDLYSELMKYQSKEPIILTKEDLKLMGKAVSYYTHGRCGE